MSARLGFRRLFILVAVLTPSFLPLNSLGLALEEPDTSKTVIYLSDGDHKYIRQMSQRVREELELLTEGRYEVSFLPDQNAGWSPARIEALLDQYLNDPEVDLIIGSGTFFFQAVKIRIPLSKPVVLASMMDPDIMSMPQTPEGTSGVPNLYYVAKNQAIDADLSAFRQAYRFKTIHILVEDQFRPYAKQVVDKLRKKDYKVELVSGSGTVSEVLSRIDQERPEALYLAPLNLSGADRQALIDGINQRKIPSFSYIGYEDVEKGVLAGRIPKLFTKLARRLAINIDRIFRGEDAGTLSTRFDIEDKFVVNQRTANQIGHSFPFNVLMNAEVLFQDDAGGG